MAGESKIKETYENGMKILEDLTNNAHELQEQMLEEILRRNTGTEYLSRFFPSGQADKQNFKTNVPIVTYEDIKPYIDRIANGEASSILFADPISQFLRSSGTSGGQQKLIPITTESFEKGCHHHFLAEIVIKNVLVSQTVGSKCNSSKLQQNAC
ncbi:hypothetical protein Golax_025697 [Gossypium laxum]|uniref:Uncharacterized protein n=1 Tax=Gossypium laxum TaxID=34288 RepID=A0A7J9AYX7_9ROSI|nr:hypothetical protein [Gossypium laxum]